MLPIFFLLMTGLFGTLLVRGFATGRMSGKGGASDLKGDPFGFWANAVMMGFFTLIMAFAAWSSSLPGN